MKKRTLALPLIILVLLSLACSLTAPAAEPTAAPVEEQPTAAPVEPTAEPAVEPTVEESGGSGGDVITSLADAKKGVIRIVVQGAYEYPDFPASLEESYTGTGFIIDPKGIAVTNNHVVTGAATIEVYFADDDEPRRAKLVAASECSDLAIIDIAGDEYPYFEWFTDPLELGTEVYSLGYPLGDPEFSQHKGAISKKRATVQSNWTDAEAVVEHDALINPGNSGGPLVTNDGKVVGVNYASLDDANQYYAITYAEAKPILDDLISGTDVLSVGLNGEAFANEDLSGIWVYSVKSGSPADKLGMKSGDILLEMEGISLAKEGTLSEYCNVLRTHNSDDVLGVKVLRYKTGEVLEGQLNGRDLEVTGTFDSGNSGSNNANDSGSAGGGTFTEDFQGDLTNWSEFVLAGNSAKKYTTVESTGLRFEIPSTETYVYGEYVPGKYQDVYIETEFETLGPGQNGVALFCRGSDKGFYELRVSTAGATGSSFQLFRYDFNLRSQGRNPYVNLLGGYDRLRTVDLVSGIYKTNKIGLLCEGQNIRVFINGVEQVKAKNEYWTDNTLADGTIGIGAMSFSQGVVKVDFYNVSVEEQ